MLNRLLDLFRRRPPPPEEDDDAFVRSLFTEEVPVAVKAPSYLVEDEPAEATEDRPYLELSADELRRHATREVEIVAKGKRRGRSLFERFVIEPMRMVVDNVRLIVGMLVVMAALAAATLVLTTLVRLYMGPLL